MKKIQPDKITSKLTSKGLKNTPHRRKIIQLLESNPKPLTAEQVFLILKSDDTLISLSTVYRILEMLSRSGLVQKWHILDEDRVRFAIHPKKHQHHFICLRCHEMIELPVCPMEEIERALEDKNGLQVTGHQLEIYGYCSHCQ